MILIDDQPYSQPCPADKTVRELAQEICGDAGPRTRRLVVAIYRDGQPVGNHELGAVLDAPVADFGDLALQTQPAAALVRSALEQALTMLEEATAARMAAADHLDHGRHPEAMQQIQKLLEIWRQLQQSLTISAEALGVDLDALVIENVHLPEMINQMRANLEELREAMRNQDPILIADLLRYQMQDVFARWGDLLTAVRASVEPN